MTTKMTELITVILYRSSSSSSSSSSIST